MSADHDALEDRALTLAAAPDAPSHAQLLGMLRSRSFLEQLDLPSDLLGPPRRLRLAGVLEALATNDARTVAHPVLVALCDDPVFTAAPARADLLIGALSVVRPAPPPAVAFWERHCRPLDGFANLTIAALLDNRSLPALALFEAKMSDPGHDEATRVGWARYEVVPRRDDPGVLEGCGRLLAGTLPGTVRVALVEALFDYRPDAWYGAGPTPEPPPWGTLPPDSRAALVGIGEAVLRDRSLDAALRETVSLRVESLRPA